jgi:hypothetical protein
MIDWNIHSRAHACQACAEPFADKQPYHTVLYDAKQEYLRRDVCAKCWEKEHGLGLEDGKKQISHWQGVYEAPPAHPPDAIQKDTAETLLRKLTQLNDSKYRAASYILAVMLERKRLLKIKTQLTENGQRVFVYEQPKTGDLFTIPDPNLQLNQLEEVQHMVGHLLEHGLGENDPDKPVPAPVATVPNTEITPQAEPGAEEVAKSEPPVAG